MSEHIVALALVAAKRLFIEHANLKSGEFNQHGANRMLNGRRRNGGGFGDYVSAVEDFAPDSGSINSRKSVPPPPYPPALKQKGYHGLQGRPLDRLPLDLQRNGGNDVRPLSRLRTAANRDQRRDDQPGD